MTFRESLEQFIDDVGADVKSLAASLANKRDRKNQPTVQLAPTSDSIERYEVIQDGTSTANWVSRVEYATTPVGGGTGGAARLVYYLNEYFEQRLIARANTVLWRAFVREFSNDPAHDMSVPIFEIQDDRNARIQKYGLFGQGNFYHSGDGVVGGGLAVSGSVTAPNIGIPIKGVYNAGSEPAGQPVGTVILVRP